MVLLVLAIALSALFSCNDPTAIGSDLVESDALDIGFTDTVTLLGHIAKQDSVLVYFSSSTTSQYENFLCGDFIDPVFGRASASIYSQISLAVSGTSPIFPRFASQGYVIDSVVLLLPYNADRSYGNLDKQQRIDVFELKEGLVASNFAYSNQTYEVFPDPIGSAVDFVPNVEDSLKILVPGTTDSTIQTPPHLRIKMGAAFQEKLNAADSTYFTRQDSFEALFKGFFLKPAPQGDMGGIVSFRMRNSFTGLRVYYHSSSGTLGEYLFPILIGDVVTANFTEDYTGTVVEKYLPVNGAANDSLFFVRGMNGINLVIEVPYAQDLKNLLVNKAELEFSILDLTSDDPYKPADRIAVSEMVDDTTQTIISDYTLAQNTTDFNRVYGGYPNTDNKYRINISSHMQKILKGTASNTMILNVSLRPEKASRVVLAGTRYFDPALRPKLRLSFSRY